MRLLQFTGRDSVSLTKDLVDNIPKYAILSHTWGADEDEVTFKDLQDGLGQDKAGYKKIIFCGEQARRDGISYFWVDTCCIDKSSHTELSEAITSMFRWYGEAVKCYVYLSDVSLGNNDQSQEGSAWELEFRESRWFTRGWTLQELLAPNVVEFYSQKGHLIGDKKTLVQLLHEVTDIPIDALRGTQLSQFPRAERMRWAVNRKTKRPEDKAYCLLGVFEVFMPLIYGEGDNAFIRLEKIIAETHGSAAGDVHKHWLVPRPAQPLFTGRTALLQELESTGRKSAYTTHPERPCRIVISGIGGQGKSEVCLRLAHRLRYVFWAVLWIDISTTEMAERSFLEIAQKLSIPAQNWQEACLGIANLKHRWLLVLDNADSPDIDYLEYFPESPTGVVLMTTRNAECQQYATVRSISLDGLGSDDACELLLKSSRVSQNCCGQYQDDARTVANLLQSHALALLQAGAYIARGHCSLATYPQIYQLQRRRLMKFRPHQAQSRYRDVYTTFEVSANALKAMHSVAAEDALQLLPLLSVCGPNRLPISMLFEAGHQGAKGVSMESEVDSNNEEVGSLTSWHIVQSPLLITTNNELYDSYRLVEAMSLLAAFSLISSDVSNGSLFVSLHPLVHAWARDRQSDKEQQQSWLQFACLMALAMAQKTDKLPCERLPQAHIEALTEWPTETMFAASSPMPIAQILYRCGWCLLVMRADTKLYKLLQKVFVALGLDWFKVERAYTGLYNLAGRNLLDYGETRKSITIFKQLIKSQEQLLAEDHPNLIVSQNLLVMAYMQDGKAKQATTLLEKVVKIQSQSLAEDHPDRLAMPRNLAAMYFLNGRGEEATTLLEKVLKIQSQSLAEDHPRLSETQLALALIYGGNGRVEEAISLLKGVLKIQNHSLAEDHPTRLKIQHNLAIMYGENGQVKEGTTLLEGVVTIQNTSLAEDHPDRLKSQLELAKLLRRSGEHQRPIAMVREVLLLSKRTLDDDHPDRQLYESWLEIFK